jgi:subfamily B ATP-binding cassette protein HlyB/CyaB
MNQPIGPRPAAGRLDPGLSALCAAAAFHRIAADPTQLARELGIDGRTAETNDVLRAAKKLGLKAREVTVAREPRLANLPVPALLKLGNGSYALFGGRDAGGLYRIVDPVTRVDRRLHAEDLLALGPTQAILLARQPDTPGSASQFGFAWFLPSIWRYRAPLAHVLLASLFIQLFALITPLFFQVVIDKVLAHKSASTLVVLVVGLIVIAAFDSVLQYLRAYALSHTSNRIDVELGQRLFSHLLKLPLAYFETRPAGQTVARIRELENIRQFLTGQGLFSVLDLVFAILFIGVLWLYSWQLTLIILGSIPAYLIIAFVIRPLLQARINEKFNRGAESQQFLVETVIGAHTVKSSAVEPLMQVQWEEKLAAYVRTSFDATMLAAGGQNAIQFVNKVTTALVLLFGAHAVIQGSLTVGELIAFNMIAGQVTQPILRLSQIWQDFQQMQVSVDRLGDVLNALPEPRPSRPSTLPPPRGHIAFRDVTLRYRPGAPDVLKRLSLEIQPGEVMGIVGPSGSGKSSLAKLVQRLYAPTEGQVLLDGADLAQMDPAWLRRQIGVVLQENVLFNRTIHENIAFANPAMSRSEVIRVARLAGADEFIARLPRGYDSMVEERGANLSGGQRQRIAIARALASDPPILIFDEATSALDYESERIIQANMREIVRKRTVIVIAHRLAAVRSCDRIIALVDGRIAEAGTHEELVGRPGGTYARLWSLQSERVVA